MKRPLLFLGILIVCALFIPARASAHVLRQNGPAAAVMHIEPDDNPQAGQATVFVFDFNDSPGTFSLRDYDTTVTASGEGSTQTSALTASYSRTGQATLRFAKPGIYDLAVSGKAQQPGIASFELQYEIRVAGSTATGDPAAAQTIGLVSLASFCILALVARRAIISGGRYHR